MKLVYLAVFVLAIQVTQADWFDDLVQSARDKIVSAADTLRDETAPAIKKKFNDIKETLQDPETHRKAKTWIEETALPAVKKPFNAAGQFIQEEVAPEVKKVFDAYKKANDEDTKKLQEGETTKKEVEN